jgi:tetratricopeptide (TPR) repeat protein
MILAMMGLDARWIISGLLLIPYLAWGWYAFYLRYRHDAELSPRVESLTLAALVFFYMFELATLRSWLAHDLPLFIIALCGLAISGVVFYGPMVLSLASNVLTEMVVPGDIQGMYEPDYSAGEACERVSDFAGAAAAYEAVARMFPKDPTAALRAAHNYMKLGRDEEAASHFESALANLKDAEEALPVAFRTAELYSTRLERPRAALRVLSHYKSRFPDTPHIAGVNRRIQRLEEKVAGA